MLHKAADLEQPPHDWFGGYINCLAALLWIMMVFNPNATLSQRTYLHVACRRANHKPSGATPTKASCNQVIPLQSPVGSPTAMGNRLRAPRCAAAAQVAGESLDHGGHGEHVRHLVLNSNIKGNLWSRSVGHIPRMPLRTVGSCQFLPGIPSVNAQTGTTLEASGMAATHAGV